MQIKNIPQDTAASVPWGMPAMPQPWREHIHIMPLFPPAAYRRGNPKECIPRLWRGEMRKNIPPGGDDLEAVPSGGCFLSQQLLSYPIPKHKPPVWAGFFIIPKDTPLGSRAVWYFDLCVAGAWICTARCCPIPGRRRWTGS